jgi:hypothetical protein
VQLRMTVSARRRGRLALINENTRSEGGQF